MPMYISEYRLPNGSRRTTQVYAENDTHLEEVLKQRCMGETARPYEGYLFNRAEPKMACALLQQGKLAKANHALVWTSMIAVRAGITDAWALLNDDGILHEMAHLIELRAGTLDDTRVDDGVMKLARRVETYERLVPGVHPCWGGDPDYIVAPARPPTDYWADMRRMLLMDSYVYRGMKLKPALADMYDLKTIRPTAEHLSKAMVILDEYSMYPSPRRDGDVYMEPKIHPKNRRFEDSRRTQGQAAKQAMIAKSLKKLKPAAAEPGKITMELSRPSISDFFKMFREDSTLGMAPMKGTVTGRTSHIIPNSIYDPLLNAAMTGKERRMAERVKEYRAGSNASLVLGGKKVADITDVKIAFEDRLTPALEGSSAVLERIAKAATSVKAVLDLETRNPPQMTFAIDPATPMGDVTAHAIAASEHGIAATIQAQSRLHRAAYDTVVMHDLMEDGAISRIDFAGFERRLLANTLAASVK